MKNVAVIGAGISGIMATYFLAKKGYSVTVFDAERYPAMKCSFANGGQLSVSNSEVWNTMANVKKGAKWMLSNDAPLYIHPSLELSKIKWLTKFLFHTIDGSYVRNTISSIKLGLKSRELYQSIRNDEQIEYDYEENGILHFYKNPKYFKSAIDSTYLYEAARAISEWKSVNTDEILAIEPALRDSSDIIGGIWSQGDSTGDIHKFCYEMTKILESRYGVKFEFNSEIIRFSTLDDFDAIVVSNGVGAQKLAKSQGDNLSIYPVKGYSITITLDEDSEKYAPSVSLLDDEAKIVSAKLGNRLRIAGTAELNGENYDIKKHRIDPLLKWVHTNFPNINTSNYSSWACLRPMTPNMIPVIKQSKKNSKVFYHAGHGHLGWTYSPATAWQLAAMVDGHLKF